LDDPLYQDPELVAFYDIENDGRDDFDFCIEMARDARSVLDLGCGTGQLAAMLADGRRVVGVDPAAAMLDIARQREGGDRVRWVEASAQTVQLGQTFDLVLLTGHAFQVFLTDEDALAVLVIIARHLAPGGHFVFDSRNPARRQWREWVPEQSERIVAHPVHGDVRAWNDVTFDETTAIATYQTFYDIAAIGRTISADAKIRFIDAARLAGLLDAAGLKVDRWFGDWTGAAFDANSKEIIPVGRLA
jgi:SAM-dependent methyltransferase